MRRHDRDGGGAFSQVGDSLGEGGVPAVRVAGESAFRQSLAACEAYRAACLVHARRRDAYKRACARRGMHYSLFDADILASKEDDAEGR